VQQPAVLGRTRTLVRYVAQLGRTGDEEFATDVVIIVCALAAAAADSG
jgi:hypothetical protein